MASFLFDAPHLSFEDWMRSLGFNERTIGSRLSNLAKLEEYFGPLVEKWLADRFKSLLEKLAYSAEDKRNGVVPEGIMPINGDLYEGLATYRSTLRLFSHYLEYLYNLATAPFDQVGAAVEKAIDRLRRQLPDKDQYSRGEVKKLIIEPLLDLLAGALAEMGYEFGSELTEDSSAEEGAVACNDRYDILGRSRNPDLPAIVIEVDTHRSDQISKKVVSRIALNAGNRLLYIALLYPNTHVGRDAEKKEAAKYFLFIDTLFNQLKAPEKKFKGYTLY